MWRVLFICVASFAGVDSSSIYKALGDTIDQLPGSNNLSGKTRCHWNPGQSFSEFINCAHEKHVRRRRQAFNPYDSGNAYDRPCSNYVRLNQPERRVSNVIDRLTDSALCDRALSRRWYRFESPAGGTMPQTCVDEFSCGTHAPIWLNGRHPEQNGDVRDMEVCLSLAGYCCHRRWHIRVANCGDFFTYLLVDTPGCFMAYCIGGELPCPPGLSSPSGFSPGCTADFPQLPGDISLAVDREGHKVVVYCDYEGRIPKGAAIDVSWFVLSSKAGPGDEAEYPVWTDRMVERRRSKFIEGRWMGKMGSSIFCRMRAVWANNTGVAGPAMDSKKFFAGIKILERVVHVDEAASEAEISIQATVPINCLPQFKDACSLSLQVAHDSEYQTKRCVDGQVRQVVFGDCTIEITPDAWHDVYKVKVKAVRDFYHDGNKKMLVGFKPTFSTLLSPIWNDYEVPAIEIIAKDAPNKMCYSTGDPHYVTFDGFYYHVYLEGEFVLYKNTRLPMQINTRMEKCGNGVTCNCAVAVKAADDVIVIDRCMRRKRNLAYGESFPDGWRTIHRHALQQGSEFSDGLQIYEYDDGKRFTVHLPTGAYIDFKVGEQWIDIYLYGSSDDYMSTLGLCGTFDGDPNNDFTFSDTITKTVPRNGEACGDSPDVCKFAESWRVFPENSFFGQIVEVPLEDASFTSPQQYCKCEQHGQTSTVVCNYHYDVDNCQARDTQRKGADRTRELVFRSRSKRSAGLDDEDDDYFKTEFVFDKSFRGKESSWPTPSGIDENSARTYCRRLLEQAQAARVCMRVIDNLPILIDSCMTDIKVTDDLSWALSALTSMTEDCVNAVHVDARNWEETVRPASSNVTVTPTNHDATTTTTAPPRPVLGNQLLLDVCPSDCSRNGKCVQGECHCYPAFSGSDCSKSRAKAPKITHLSSGGLCDLNKKACLQVRVYGTDFRNTSRLYCRFRSLQLRPGQTAVASETTENVPAFFDTFEEVICRLPTQTHVGDSPTYRALEVQVANDDDHVTDPAIFIVHDSRCRACVVNGRSSQCPSVLASCEIAGFCYSPGDRNPSDCCMVCDPADSRDTFQRPARPTPPELLPYQTTYMIKKGDPWDLQVSARNPDTCRVTLDVNANSGDVSYTSLRSDAVQLLLTTQQLGRYSADVIATDECGATVERTYRAIMADELPEVSHSSSKANTLECDDNRPPEFKLYRDGRLTVYAVPDEELTLDIQAEDPEGRPLEYHLMTHVGNPGRTITLEGHLRLRAPTRPAEEDVVVVGVDDCNMQAFLSIHISTQQCVCENGGTCVSKPGKAWNRRAYDCDCPDAYTGSRCRSRRRHVNG